MISLDTFGGPNGPLRLTYRRIRTGYASSELTRKLLSGICKELRTQGTRGDLRPAPASPDPRGSRPIQLPARVKESESRARLPFDRQPTVMHGIVVL